MPQLTQEQIDYLKTLPPEQRKIVANRMMTGLFGNDPSQISAEPGIGSIPNAIRKIRGLVEAPANPDRLRMGQLGEAGYGDARNRQQGVYDQLGRQMMGEDSLSGEQLRQDLQRTLSMQRSMAAGARPGNQAMAARNAATQMGRLSSGMAGQGALAGIAERNAAAQTYGGLLGQQAGQDAGLMTAAYSKDEPSDFEKYAGAVKGGLELYTSLPDDDDDDKTRSDRRAKFDIRPGGRDAERFLDGLRRWDGSAPRRAEPPRRQLSSDEFLEQLRAHSFNYKNPERDGRGRQLGVMAQDLERTPVGRQAVIDTPDGKMVDGGKLATALAAALGDMHGRVRQLEESPSRRMKPDELARKLREKTARAA